MNLYILYNLDTSNNDGVNEGLGKYVSESKHFQHKTKLVLNDKSQLNSLIKTI